MKRVKFGVLIAVLSVLLLGITGCGGKTPDSVAKKCVDCLENADFDGMRQISTGEMIQWVDRAERRYAEIGKLLGEKRAKKFKSTYDDLKYEVGEINAGSEKVSVPVKINGQDTPMTLIKLGESWRVEKFDFPII